IDNYKHTALLVERKALVVEVHGELKLKHIFLQSELFRKVRKFVAGRKLILILDFSQVVAAERAVRKLYQDKIKELAGDWEEVYLILSPALKLSYKIFFFFNRNT